MSKRLRLGYLNHVATLIGAAGAGHAILILSSPITSRIYSPEDFGQLGLFSALVICAAVLGAFRYESAIIAADTDNDAENLVIGASILSAVSSLVAGGVLYALVIKGLLGYGALSPWSVPVATLCVFSGTVYNVLRAYSIRNQAFGVVAKSVIIRNSVTVLTQVVFGLLGLSWLGLFLSDLIGKVIGCAWILVSRKKLEPATHDESRLVRVRKVIAKYKQFPLLSFPSSILDSVSSGLAIPIVTQLYGTAVAGEFRLAHTVMLLPAAVVSGSVADVFHNRLSIAKRENPSSMPRLFRQTVLSLLLVSLIPSVMVSFFGVWAFERFFGAQWAMAGQIVSIMAPWMIMSMAVSPVSRVVFVLGGQHLKLIYDALVLGSVIGVFYYCSRQHVEMFKGVWILCWAYAAPYLAYYLLLSKIVNLRSKAVPEVRI